MEFAGDFEEADVHRQQRSSGMTCSGVGNTYGNTYGNIGYTYGNIGYTYGSIGYGVRICCRSNLSIGNTWRNIAAHQVLRTCRQHHYPCSRRGLALAEEKSAPLKA